MFQFHVDKPTLASPKAVLVVPESHDEVPAVPTRARTK